MAAVHVLYVSVDARKRMVLSLILTSMEKSERKKERKKKEKKKKKKRRRKKKDAIAQLVEVGPKTQAC